MGETPIRLFDTNRPPLRVLIDDLSISTIFGLDRSHMIHDTELDTAWLLGEALNRHQTALAALSSAGSGVLPHMGDSQKPARIVFAGIDGLSDAYCKGDTVALDLKIRPTAANGLKSVTTLRSHQAHPVHVTICSAEKRPHQARSGSRPGTSKGRAVELDKTLHMSPDGDLSLPHLMRLVEASEHDTLPSRSSHRIAVSREISVLSRPKGGDTAMLVTDAISKGTATHMNSVVIGAASNPLATICTIRVPEAF